MADYYTNFSLILPLPNEDVQRYALDLAANAQRVQQGDEPTITLDDRLQEVVEEWSFETDAENSKGQFGLWLHSEYGGIEAVCAFIQHLLQKFDPAGQVGFQWSFDCSKPRVDAYGGGAAFVTAKEIKTMSTSEWLHQQVQSGVPSP